ncbi:MAG TPA: hypothetical protein VI756_20310 [Blastocatellia bacterium]
MSGEIEIHAPLNAGDGMIQDPSGESGWQLEGSLGLVEDPANHSPIEITPRLAKTIRILFE